jgi:hypothetical protein
MRTYYLQNNDAIEPVSLSGTMVPQIFANSSLGQTLNWRVDNNLRRRLLRCLCATAVGTQDGLPGWLKRTQRRFTDLVVKALID